MLVAFHPPLCNTKIFNNSFFWGLSPGHYPLTEYRILLHLEKFYLSMMCFCQTAKENINFLQYEFQSSEGYATWRKQNLITAMHDWIIPHLSLWYLNVFIDEEWMYLIKMKYRLILTEIQGKTKFRWGILAIMRSVWHTQVSQTTEVTHFISLIEG